MYLWSVTDVFRPQTGKPETCLATIEAVYYFFKEYDQHILKRFVNASTVPYLFKKLRPLIWPCQISTLGKILFLKYTGKLNPLNVIALSPHHPPPNPPPSSPINSAALAGSTYPALFSKWVLK